jgi:hypothetical protein
LIRAAYVIRLWSDHKPLLCVGISNQQFPAKRDILCPQQGRGERKCVA